MSMSLPTGGFRWLSEQEIAYFDILSISVVGEKGYVLEVDLDYPRNILTKHNDYPLCPESIFIDDDMLPPYSRELFQKIYPRKKDGKLRRANIKKLIPNLNHKRNYVIHYKNLQQCLQLGLKLKAIHKILEFDQSPWLEKYIQFNTNQRKLAVSKFEKNFFKQMNNSVFGKTMENLRKRLRFLLIHSQKKFKREVAKSYFKRFTILNEDLVGLDHF